MVHVQIEFPLVRSAAVAGAAAAISNATVVPVAAAQYVSWNTTCLRLHQLRRSILDEIYRLEAGAERLLEIVGSAWVACWVCWASAWACSSPASFDLPRIAPPTTPTAVRHTPRPCPGIAAADLADQCTRRPAPPTAPLTAVPLPAWDACAERRRPAGPAARTASGVRRDPYRCSPPTERGVALVFRLLRVAVWPRARKA